MIFSLMKSARSVLVIIFFLSFSSVCPANVPTHEVRLYHQKPFVTEQDKFFPFDTIYTVVDFIDIEPGDYHVNIDWIRPDGKLARNSSHPFTLEKKVAKYRVYFWLKLNAKGPLGQMLSGEEYTPSVFGEWKVKLSCNGQQLSSTAFLVSEDHL